MAEKKSERGPGPARFIAGVGVAVCLAVGLVSLHFRRQEDPSWARIHAQLAVVNAALEKYHADHGSWPEGDSLEVLVPQYLPEVPVDPWGRPYIYENNGKRPLLVTFGQDGERGGTGVEQDHHQYDGHVK
jgi:general secretion pathway protein G